MIFIYNSGKIYFNLNQCSKLYDVLLELQQLSKDNNFWFERNKFNLKNKSYFNKYMMYACMFNLVKIKTDTFFSSSINRNIKHYRYKVKNPVRFELMLNIIKLSLANKDNSIKVKCSNCEVIENENEEIYSIQTP